MALPSYKYYKLDITGTSASSRAALATIEFYTDMAATTLASTVGATATASTEFSATYPASNALDGSISTAWLSANAGVPAWWQIEFAQAETIYSLVLNVGSWSGETMTSFNILASNDGVNWDTLQQFTGITQTINTDYAYDVAASISSNLNQTYDLAGVGTAAIATQIDYDLNGVSIVTPELDLSYAVTEADNINVLLNQYYSVTGTNILRFRVINDWGLQPGGVFITGVFGMAWDVAPEVGTASITFPSLTVSVAQAASGSISTPALTVAASGSTGGGVVAQPMTLPALTASIRAGSPIGIETPLIQVSASGSFINRGSVSAILPFPVIGVAGDGGTVGRAAFSLPHLTGALSALVGTSGTGAAKIRLTLLASGTTGASASAQATLPAFTLTATAFASGSGSVSVFLPKLRMEPSVRTADGGAVFSGWALNVESKALTEYAGLGFNSMATFHGVSLAASTTGLSKLTGDLDDIYTIDATLTTSQEDFDSHFLKRMRDAYIGLRANGGMILKTITDENVIRAYPLDRVRDGMHEQRVKLSRGVKSKYWQIGLENVDGSDFEIDSITLEPEVLSRRVR